MLYKMIYEEMTGRKRAHKEGNIKKQFIVTKKTLKRAVKKKFPIY